MVKIWGKIICNQCNFEGEDLTFPDICCPSCGDPNIKHSPSAKIFLCPYDNTWLFAINNLPKTHKQVLKGIKQRDKVYQEVRNFINIQASQNNKPFLTKDLLQYLQAISVTDGDTVRNILHICVCEGYVKKEFMKTKKYHLYTPLSNEVSPCKYLIKKSKGRNIGVYECSFDFVNQGKKLSAKDIFTI